MIAGRQLEVCVETLQGCEAASAGGADRIELCAALDVGGVTPSANFLCAALATATVPVHVLIRPRSGNFHYTAAEFELLCEEARDALYHGAAGIVTGILTENGEVDRARMERVMRYAEGRSVTFHRAFDRTSDLFSALEAAIELGCDRVLTSGGKPNVTEGAETLAQLSACARGRIRIAAGSGVTLETAERLCRIGGLDLHGSFRGPGSSGKPPNTSDPLWNDDPARQYVNPETVRAVRALMNRFEEQN